MLRILLADDHGLTRAGLRYLLARQKDRSVCGEASNVAFRTASGALIAGPNVPA